MSNELKEAAQQALNALDEATTYTGSPWWSPSMTDDCIAAASALRTALQQAEAQQPATGEPVKAERDQLRCAQADAVMPLIGPLLDAWENADREVMSQEPELSKQLKNINSAMEDAQPATGEPVGVNQLRKELSDANDFIQSLADLCVKYETLLGYRKTKAPEGASELAEARGESNVNTELDLAMPDSICDHVFVLDPKSSIRICNKCGTVECKKHTRPAPSVPDDVVRDAERYEWLRQHQLLAKINYMPTPSGEDLDAAIDAAMLSAKDSK